jgi:imidazolonepropionase-like amidohydrolase
VIIEHIGAIRGCSLVDPRSGRVRDNVDISWGLHHIDSVTTGRGTTGDMPYIDGTGLYAVPGLIDMHVHMASDPSGQILGEKGTFGQTTMVLLAAYNLRMALESGVTTVRDLGTPGHVSFDVKRAWEKGILFGARPVVSGPVITAIGGHGAKMGLQSSGPEMVRRHVRQNLDAGADLIKLVMASASRSKELSFEELAAGVDEAHSRGYRVAAHANFSADSIVTALRAGCDTVEHGYILTPHAIGLMRERNASLCPTISALRAVVDHSEVFAERAGEDLAVAALANLSIAEAGFRRAIEAGVRIVAGTDAGVPFNGFDSIHRELAFMVEWGMSPVEALRAATCDAADVLGRTDLGRLAPGMSADALMLSSNPLDDLAALADVRFVLQRGTVAVNREPARIVRPAGVARAGATK